MDRLICGDAGFGKTEVALRAALIAVMDGRQVAMLVPTTVLAEQHWNTFRKRFKDYPVRIEMVSRFRSAQGEQGGYRRRARAGKVDIVIGTHRLLQDDVEFQAPGPADHRRGASLRGRRQGADQAAAQAGRRADPDRAPRFRAPCTWRCSGSATFRVIQTPPPDRQAIRTFVAHFDDGLHPRSHPARAQSRRAGVLRAQPGREHRVHGAPSARAGARGESCDRARPDEGARSSRT